MAVAMDNFQDVQALNLTCADVKQDGACLGITARTWSTTDWMGHAAEDCAQRIIDEVEPNALTDLSN